MKVISSFVLLLSAVTVFASDSPPVETHQVLYLADAGVVVLRLSVVVEGEGLKQCHEKFVDALLKSLDKNGDGVGNGRRGAGADSDAARGSTVGRRSSQVATHNKPPHPNPLPRRRAGERLCLKSSERGDFVV